MVRCCAALVLIFTLYAAISPAGEGDAFQFQLGGMRVAALLDSPGGGTLRLDLLIGLDEEQKKQYLVPGSMDNSINAFLITIKDKNLLFDTGLGAGRGRLLDSLRQAGFAPGDIDAVIITHFHGDHVGGLLKDGKAAFPNARLILMRTEVDNWNPDELGFIDAYGDRVEQYEFGDEVWPGVTSIEATGHTAGHTAFLIQAGGKQLLVVADAIHFPAVQLPLPNVAVGYDTDPVKAVEARKNLFDLAIREKLPIASMHISFPGVGVLGRAGNGYTYASLEDAATMEAVVK